MLKAAAASAPSARGTDRADAGACNGFIAENAADWARFRALMFFARAIINQDIFMVHTEIVTFKSSDLLELLSGFTERQTAG
jgi:hypothetical protein